jgi:FkbM family methyltransferase
MINHLKDLVRRRLAKRGWELTKLTAHNGNELDLASLAIEHCILTGDSTTLLQIGANDGVRKDPVRELIKRYNLSAILVEPIPHLFEALINNYSGYPKIRFENVAVSSKAGTALIYRIDPHAKEFPDWVQGTATLDRNVIMKHQVATGLSRSQYERHIQEISISVITVTELFARHPDINGASIVVIDTEGHDFEVLRSVLEAGIVPRLIIYEHKHLSVEDQVECRSSLSGLNYHLISGGDDTIAYLRS